MDLNSGENNTYDICQKLSVDLFNKEKEEAEKAFVESCKKTRPRAITFLLITIAAFTLLMKMFSDYGFRGATEQYSIIPLLLIIFVLVMLAFTVKEFKQYRVLRNHFEFRVHNLTVNYSDAGIYLPGLDEEIKTTVRQAYKKYGVKFRWFLIPAIVILSIVVIKAVVAENNSKFTKERWNDYEKRPYCASQISSYAERSVRLDDIGKEQIPPEYDFSKMRLDEIHSLLGLPEIVVYSYYNSENVVPSLKYTEDMGKPLNITYDLTNPYQSVYCEQYFCGDAYQNDDGQFEWLCFIWMDNELKYCTLTCQNVVKAYYNNQINEVLFKE